MSVPNEIFTDRMMLRPPRESDAEQIFARYGQDSDVSRYMSWTPHQSIDDTLAFLRRIIADNNAGRSCGYLIFSRVGDELLGSVGGAIDQHRMQFGYCLAQDSWGRGFATEAARAFIEAVFAQLPVLRIQAYCDVQNPASARVLEKAGLTLEGTLHSYLMLPNLGDAARDILMYAKVRHCAVSK
jgi:[ribosomal protein S5]-alanine N-acetyltransferase